MPGRIHLFVSAGPDLEMEREHLARALARFPVALGWELDYTPSSDQEAAPDLSPIQASDFYVILMGRDIHAPVGWELALARQLGKGPLAFAKSLGRTPAGEVFYKQSRLPWTRFEKPDELTALLQQALAQKIAQDPSRYDLSMAEWQTLSAFLEQGDQEAQAEEPTWGGAGQGAVIFSPTHYEPSQGVLLEEPEDGPGTDRDA